MADEALKEPAENNAATEDMDLEEGENGVGLKAKRAREVEDEGDGDVPKKQKLDEHEDENSVEEQRLDKKLKGREHDDGNGSSGERLGPKEFGSSIQMFDYFYKFLHYWPPNVNVNRYEHMVLMDLLKKGHSEPDTKIGVGIQAFQVRYHPTWKSRCFFLIREDDTFDDFSFRKCVDHILPLPEDMKTKFNGGNSKGRGVKGGGRGRGSGRGGKSRN